LEKYNKDKFNSTKTSILKSAYISIEPSIPVYSFQNGDSYWEEDFLPMHPISISQCPQELYS
jgi:hypothetical protein